MTTAEQYAKDELAAGRLTLRHITLLTRYFQAVQGIPNDGKPGPRTLAELDKVYPPEPVEPGRFLAIPLPTIRGAFGSRRPHITSKFRTDDRPYHNGIDLFYKWEPGDKPDFVGDGGCEGKNADGSPKWVVPYGTYAQAGAAGTIQVAGPSPTGYRVWVNHGNGLRSGHFHLASLLVRAGDKVSRGTALGLVGNSPRGPDGNHLHFEVSPVDKYEPLNPELYLELP